MPMGIHGPAPTRLPILLFLATALVAGCEEPPPVAPPPVSTEVTETAFLWTGFHHRWSLNHRLNRLGSYVGPTSCGAPEAPEAGDTACRAPVVHTAASGIGSDTARFRSFPVLVDAPGVAFRQGTVYFPIDLRRSEGRTLIFHHRERVPAEGPLARKDQAWAVLGGFDLAARGDADKLERLRLSLGEVTQRSADGDWVFDVELELELACRSVECAAFERAVRYDFYVVYDLVAADRHEVRASTGTWGRTYTWGNRHREEELDLAGFGDWSSTRVPRPAELPAQPLPGETALALLREVEIDLDRDHWMVALDVALRDQRYDPVDASLGFHLDLGFKQWSARTWRHPLSFTRPGGARLEAGVTTFWFREATVAPVHTEGEIVWKANGRPPTDASSSHTDLAVVHRDGGA